MGERPGTATRPGSGGRDAAPNHSARLAARARARRRARWRASGLAVLGLAAVAGAFWALAFSSLLAVRQVEVAGVDRLSVAEVAAVAAVPTGGSLVLLDTGSIAARVRALPAVAKVEIERRPPHTVRIAVTERQATAVVATPSGLQLADAQGVRFAAVTEAPRGLPLVRTAEHDPSPETLARAAALLEALPEPVRKLVREIRADSADDMAVELRGGRTVVWGSSEQGALKARVLGVLFDKRRADLYDVSVPEAPLIRR